MLIAEYVRGQGIVAGQGESREPADGEVTIDVAYTGICGTDLHIAHGDMDARVGERAILGHEMSGTVAAVGPGAERWSIGTPVTVMPLIWCNACATCRAGHRHICERLEFVGIDSPGSLQQRWTVPQDVVIALPADMSLRDAALVEPVAVAHHDVERGRVAAGDTVVVVGGGPVGLLIAMVAKHRGAAVTVVELDEFRRGVIETLGIAAVDPRVTDAAALVAPLHGGAGADVAFEVSGSQGGISLAMDVLRPRGRLVVVGIHAQPREVDLKKIFWKEIETLGARVYERRDYDAAIELISSGAVPAGALVSQVVPLRDAPEAFAALAQGGPVMKVLIDVQQEAK